MAATCFTAPFLKKKMLAMMSLMQALAKDATQICAPRATLLKRLEDVATKEWLAVLREGK